MKVYIVIEQYKNNSYDYYCKYIKDVFATRDGAEKYIFSYDMNRDSDQCDEDIWYEDEVKPDSDIVRSFYKSSEYGEESTDFKIIEREIVE